MKKRLLASVFTLGLTGCLAGNPPELVAYRETVHSGTSALREEYIDFAEGAVGANDKTLPDLSNLTQAQKDAWLKARKDNVAEYEKLYTENKALDKVEKK